MNNKQNKLCKLIAAFVFMIVFVSTAKAQNITGPISVQPNTTATYTLDIGISFMFEQWIVTNGYVVSSNRSGTTFTATIQWGGLGTGTITFKDRARVFGTLTVTVQNPPPTTDGLSDENYIYTITPQIATTDVSSLTATEQIEAVTYYDGLGRPMQQVAINAGGNSEDIITHIDYDDFGRNAKEFLPYTATIAKKAYRNDAENSTYLFYNTAKYENTTNPYSEKLFEASPLNKVLKQAAPGDVWKMHSGKEIEFEYDFNNANEVQRFDVSTTLANNVYTPALSSAGHYGVGELYRIVTIDENHSGSGTNHTTEEFKDKNGRVVLKRTYGQSDLNKDGDTDDTGESNATHDTYYVYDDFGNLTYVFPPLVNTTDGINSDELNELSYQYKYDFRNRLVEKKIPGKGWEFIVYDKLDRPVMTQDALQRPNKEWLFTKYDPLGRVAYTGIYTHSIVVSEQHSMQSHYNTNTTGATATYETKVSSGSGVQNSRYNSVNFPNSSIEILTVNYYDNYTFDLAGGPTPLHVLHAYGDTPTNNVKGLATGSRVKVLNQSPEKWITTILYYDDKGRTTYTYAHNEYLETTDKISNDLDAFTGRLEATTTVHVKGILDTITTEDIFTYDHMGRVTKQTQELDNSSQQEVLYENNYDDLGQLTSKDVGGKSTQPRLQTVDYTYNIRGWLKQINDVSNIGSDLFAFKLNYNTPTHGATALFNGNISEVEWKTANTDNSLKWYAYSYDALNRLTEATASNNDYSLEAVNYDKNGNITNLQRRGHTNAAATLFGTMDDLSYSYDLGNKLLKVTDTGNDTHGFKDGTNIGNDYTYDVNGNMTKDINKGIKKIEYNHLNLPTRIEFPEMPGITSYIEYVYDATGVKLSKEVHKADTSVPETTITNYAGNYMYEGALITSATLKFFNHAEGYVAPNASSGYDYIYQYKDHLGNIRLSYKDISTTSTPNLQIQEENNYYPFGLKHKGYNNIPITNHPYKYNSKELEEELDLNWYDYGARRYDPTIGRWHVTDGKAEFYFANSPYIYALNTPIQAIDPDGNLVIFINGLGGGGANYWRVYEKRRVGVTLNRMGNEVPVYKPYLRAAFDLSVSTHLEDNNRMYIDGSEGSIFNNFTSEQRFRQGYARGEELASSIIESLARDPQGNITETIKIVSHSMGGVYGKGFVKALKKYIKNHKDPRVRRALISLVADFDPFQAGSEKGKADDNTYTQQFINAGWLNIFGAGWLANQEEEGADDITDNKNKSSHFINTFFDNIANLQEGTYEWDEDKEEWICTSCKND